MFGFGKKDKEKASEKPAKAEAKPAAVAVKERPAEKEKPAKFDLKVKVAERKPCLVTLAIEVPAGRVKEETEESFRRIQGRAKMPGFRPGKAPLDLVRKNFDPQAREDALDRLLRLAVHEALQKEDLVAVATPAVDKIQYDADKPLKFDLKVECAPEVKLKDFKGLAVEKPAGGVTDEDVNKRIEDIRETNAKLVESAAETVGDGHFAVVDYVGTLDGLPVENGRAENQLIDMSAPQSIAGFTEGLRGAKKGETREVPVKFPDEHPNKKLAGKQIVFKVTLKEIKEKQSPAVDDDFAKDVGCDSLEDLKSRLRRNLEAERSRAERQHLERQVSDKLLELNPFDVPPSLVEERARHLVQNLKQYLMRQGASEEDWKANEAKMTEKNRHEAERQVRLSYILTQVGEDAKVQVTEKDVDEMIEKALNAAEPGRRSEMERWMKSHRDELHAQLREEKIFTLLIDSAKVTEAAPAK